MFIVAYALTGTTQLDHRAVLLLLYTLNRMNNCSERMCWESQFSTD